jgi:hypothetical protein
MKRFLSLSAICAALAACTSEPAPTQPFTYDLTRNTDLDIEARTADGPTAGVLVSVRTPPPSPGLVGEQLWVGATTADGHARARIRSDRAGDTVEVTLHRAGFRGPWTDDASRIAAGPLAPTARLTLPLTDVSGLHVTLERSP